MAGEIGPYDVILALRALDLTTPAQVGAWMDAPHADLDGVAPALAVEHGRYDDVIRAIVLEIGRRGLARYHPGLVKPTYFAIRWAPDSTERGG